jgi:acyl-coenzyme A thioesterase PaaI-like protein
MTSPLLQRVERTLLACRDTKLAFPSVFLDFTGQPVAPDKVVVKHKNDPAFLDAAGALDWCAVAAVLDGALGATCAAPAGPRVRPATAYIQLQLTGAIPGRDVAAEATFKGFADRSSVRQALAAASIHSGETLVAYGSAKCVLVELPVTTARLPWPWLPQGYVPSTSGPVEFDAGERDALARCAAAEAATSGTHAFIEHFWSGVPVAGEGGASLEIAVTPHLANRVGHFHGGLMLGTAMKVANAAAPPGMRLSNISAYFLSPGLGPVVRVTSTVLQQSRRLAVVRTQVVGATGKPVAETTSQHVDGG